MIARLAVSPRGIRELSGDHTVEPHEVKGRHAAVVGLIRKHGVLVVGGPRDRQALEEAIRAVGDRSPESGRAWTQLLASLVRHRRSRAVGPGVDVAIDDVVDAAGLHATWSGRIDVAMLTDRVAKTLGVGPSDHSAVEQRSGIEVTTARRAERAECFARMRELRHDRIFTSPVDRELFWSTVMEPIVRHARHVSLSDRYLFFRLAEWDRAEQVAWLLERIDALPGESRRVTLLGSYVGPKSRQPAPRSADQAAELVRRHWQPAASGSITRLELFGARLSPQLPHPRHMHCDNGFAIQLDKGFEPFKNPRSRDDVRWDFHWTKKSLEGFRAERSRLCEHRTSQQVTIFERD